jgi:ubiquitin carboxyl-terminal hydrolase 25
VPEPDLEDPDPFVTSTNIILDNLIHELSVLISQRPPEELSQHPDILSPMPALQALERTLSCQNYDKHPASRRMGSKLFELAETRPGPYNTLGAPQTASDDLIVQAYREQMRGADRRTGPKYLDSLRIIGASRSSEVINEIYVLELSKGLYDEQALWDSYRSFGLDLHDDGSYDDSYILGIFESRLQDMKKHERDLREKLRIIGCYRGSRNIIDTAENAINTYEQALLFLGADESVSDDQITALFGAKVGDNKNLETHARAAVKLIADHRSSIILQNWISSGFAANDLQMSAAEGYQALQIDNRTIEDDMIKVQYEFAVGENAANAEYYTKALEAIARDRDSFYLRNAIQHIAPQPAHGSDDEPVGLDNIGNTCYLNSLLQFLFTMLELRQVVLDFDQYRMEVNETTMQQKKVGQRQVTNREVETAQKFVQNLALLFKGMIETPQSAIRPEKELARLTLESDSAKERVRRRSTLKGDRPNLGHIDSQPIIGPLPMPDPQVNGVTDEEMSQSPLELGPAVVSLDEVFANEDWHEPNITEVDVSSNKDNSSEATLVSRPGSTSTPLIDLGTAEEQQKILDNKENLSPTKETTLMDTDDHETQPLRLASPSKVNAQAGALAKQEQKAEESQEPVVYAPPAGKPPPVPPRKPVEPTTDILEEYARQQDVTEVIAHCLFQFSCAMRPTGVDKSGEQLDEIHDLFFGRNVGHVVGGKEAALPVQFYSIITRVANEPNDVYAALDTEYDLSVRDNGTSAFLSIDKAPPVFSIALDRVVWDAQLKRPTKLNHHVHVPETIFLDRYLESEEGSDLMKRRQQTWALKKELSSLTDRRKVLETQHANTSDLPQLYDQAKIILEHLQNISDDPSIDEPLEISPSLVNTIGAIATTLRSELDNLKSRIGDLEQQIRESFADMRKHPYRLHAAFFHRGGASGGHYWVYIYDHKKEIWRSYNDDRVNVVQNLNEIFGNPGEPKGGYSTPANPYFLVYVKDGEIGKLVESVKRDIVYPPPVEAPNIPQFGGFGGSVVPNSAQSQPMSQMSAMPPGGDVEMVEYATAASMNMNGASPDDVPPPLPARSGGAPQWDNGVSELIRPPRGGW